MSRSSLLCSVDAPTASVSGESKTPTVLAMLEQLPCVCIEPAPCRPQPISSSVDGRAIRFELERQACQSLRQVLQLKLQRRRTREDLIKQGIMPPLKSSAAFHEQRRSLERAQTEDYLKRKIKSRPPRSDLIRMHILEETSAEPSLQVKQLQLKKARLALDLNDKISHRPGPMELIHKNILPVHSSLKQAIETQFPNASGDSSSCDVDSRDSLSPVGQVVGTPPSPPDAESCTPSPTQDPPAAPHLPLLPGPRPSLTNGMMTASAQRMVVASLIRTKSNSDRSLQRPKKPKDIQPKIKKLKYHQYVPPDQKGDREPPALHDSSYSKILQQQQLLLQLQILTQQQQQPVNYQAILPAPRGPQKNQQPSSSNSTAASSPPLPLTPPPAALFVQSSAPGTQAVSLPPNLDEMKVAELKSQLKLRSLPVSGNKTDLIQRLRAFQELSGDRGTASSLTAGGNAGPGAEGAGRSSSILHPAAAVTDSTSPQQQQLQLQRCQASSQTSQRAAPQQLMTCRGVASPPPASIALSDHLSAASSPEDSGISSDALEEMMRSPLSQLSPQLPASVKEESSLPAPAPCRFSVKPASLQRPVPSAVPTAAVRPLDKDKLLQEKDKQIEELTRMLRQKQRLVEVLRMQLEHGNRGAQLSEPVVVFSVKKEALGVPLEPVHPPLPPRTSSVDAKVTIKQELQSLNSRGSYSQTQEAQMHHECLQQNALQHDLHKLLLQQQSCNPALENQQKPCQETKEKSHTRQQKRQIVMKPLFRQSTKQPQQIRNSTIHQQQQQQQAPQASQESVKEPCGSALSLLPWSDSAPALVTDGDGNHFLITLTNFMTENHRTDAPEGNVANHITVQVENRGLHVSGDRPQQGAPPSLQPLLQNQEATPSRENTCSPSPRAPPEHEEAFVDIILQTGETATPFNTDSPVSSSSPSPFQLMLSPPFAPSHDSSLPSPLVLPELEAPGDATREEHHLCNAGSGRLEDFLESTTGKPLLGVEPGGLPTLIDDLHGQMLCTPSILHSPPSPMDTFDMPPEEERSLDAMHWLDLPVGAETGEESHRSVQLASHTPPSIFSTDFLDSYDLEVHWDSCL